MKKRIGNIIKAALITAAALTVLAGCGAGKGGESGKTGKSEPKNVNTVLDLDLDNYIEPIDYKAMEVSVTKTTLDQNYVDYFTKQQYSSIAGSIPADQFILDRAVENGDMINLDYSGKKDGVIFDGGTAQNQTLWIGSHSFIDGFEDGLIGVKPGETVDLNLTFPANYKNEELAGADVVFTCTVNGIITEEAIIDSFNASYSSDAPVKGYDGLVEFISNYLENTYETQYQSNLGNAIVENLINSITTKKEFPASLILKYQDVTREELETNANYYGYTADEYANAVAGKTADQYIQDSSYEQLKMDAAVCYIADKENMIFSDEELENRLREMLAGYGRTDYEAALTELNIDLPMYKVYFLEEDVIEYLKGIVTNNG